MNDIEKTLFLVGRVLVGFFFLVMGLNHFGNLAEMTAMVSAEGIPAPAVAVIVSGILLVLAGVSFIVGFHPPMGVLAAALFFVPVTLVMHDFWSFEETEARWQELNTFLRNVGLLGAVLVFLAIPRPWPMSLDRYLQKWRYGKLVDQERSRSAEGAEYGEESMTEHSTNVESAGDE